MRQLTALGGDVFAGLFTRGVQRAGFKILGHLEHTTYGTATARLNFPDLDIRNGAHTWRPEEFRGRVDLMYTNPPCAAWSSLQLSSPWQEHTERLQIVRDLVTAGLVVQPRAWCWESVCGAWTRGREFVLEQAETWLAHSYHVTVLLEDAQHLGGNQRRPRMFLIAHRHPLVWEPLVQPKTVDQLFAAAARTKKPPAVPDLVTPATFQQLWGACANMGRDLRRTVVAQDAHSGNERGPRPSIGTTRLHGDRSPRTFVAAIKTMHPHEPRFINWHEALALSGLPLSWRTSQLRLDQASRELARAVMPAVGEWLARSVATGLARPRLRTRTVEARLVDLRDPKHPRDELLMSYAPPDHAPLVTWDPALPSARAVKRLVTRVPTAATTRRPGSGARTRELILAGMETTEIVTTIHTEFPTSRATSADVSWNRGRLRREGKL